GHRLAVAVPSAAALADGHGFGALTRDGDEPAGVQLLGGGREARNADPIDIRIARVPFQRVALSVRWPPRVRVPDERCAHGALTAHDLDDPTPCGDERVRRERVPRMIE